MIFYYRNNDPNIYEGKNKIDSIIYTFLKKRYGFILKTFNRNLPTYISEKDIIYVNSSGILEALKYYNFSKSKFIIYSLYSNLKTRPLLLLKDMIDFFKIQNNQKINKLYQFKRLLFPFLLSLLPWFVIRKILGNMNIVILPNFYLYKKLKLRNAMVINIGIDINEFSKKNKSYSGQKIIVAYIGHPAVNKGIIEVAKIFSKLDNRKFRKVMFLSSLSINLDYLKKIDQDIEIFGPQKNIVDIYNFIDILMLPYRHEISSISVPLVLIEAMACEVPIIASDLPHIKEVGRDALIYVKPFDVEKFVNKIDYLANNLEKRLEMGKKARDIVVKYYNEKKMLSEYRKLFDSLLKNCGYE